MPGKDLKPKRKPPRYPTTDPIQPQTMPPRPKVSLDAGTRPKGRKRKPGK